jgi:hypothetical protein
VLQNCHAVEGLGVLDIEMSRVVKGELGERGGGEGSGHNLGIDGIEAWG